MQGGHPVPPEKSGAFQPEPLGKFEPKNTINRKKPEPPRKLPVEPGKTGTEKDRSFSTATTRTISCLTGENRNWEKPELFSRNNPENSQLTRVKPEPEKTGAFP